MPTFVPGFDHDVFISYGQVDNQPLIPGNPQSQWVDTFVDLLQAQLFMKLGRRGLGEIWKDDRKLQGNSPLTPDIQRAIQHTATLVVILSEGYLASPWCTQERELFLAQAGEQLGERLFIVDLGDVPLERRPDAFSDRLGYAFYRRERDGDNRTLGRPVPREDDIEYFQRVDDLARDLAAALRGLRTAAEQALEAVPASINAPAAQQPCVFLTETTPDLDELQDNLRRHLDQAGIRVLPERVYPRDPEGFRQAMELDLANCQVLVQLLGPYLSRRTDKLPEGYEGLQLDLAAEAKLPVLRWHDPDLDTASIRDPSLIQRLPVMVMGFEDFKQELLRTLRRQQESSPVLVAGDHYILINAQQADTEAADALSRALEDHAVGYEVVDEHSLLEDLVQEDLYSALMVVYVQGPQDWVRQQVRSCRRIMLELKTRAPLCAIYSAATPEQPPLRIRPPRFYFLQAGDAAGLRHFIAALSGSGEAP